MAKLAIDLHGGDSDPSVLFFASTQFLKKHPQHQGIFLGQRSTIEPFKALSAPKVSFVVTSELGLEAENPARLIKNTGDSSIEKSYQLLAKGSVDAVITSEHTGVLMALMTKYGVMHQSVNRPILASWLPTPDGETVMLDLGASFTATHTMLLTYAAIAKGLLKEQSQSPRIAILNVGKEQFKGPLEIRKADKTLRTWPTIRYEGFVEASDVFKGQLDAILCDGFTGNSVIKSAEGASELILTVMRDKLSKGIIKPLLGRWLAKELKTELKKLDHRHANGALVVGSDLLVIKSHGGADEVAFGAALERAVSAHEQQLVPSVLSQLDWFCELQSLDESDS